MQLKIYGDDAKKIIEGQTFTASIGSVEGRTVVTLQSEETVEKIIEDELDFCPLCYEKLDGKKSHGSWCK